MSNPIGTRRHFVYWLFDEDGECLYVGMTRRPKARWAAHRFNKPLMFRQIAYKRMAGPFEMATARKLEREQHEDLRPIYDRLFGCPTERKKRNKEQEFQIALEEIAEGERKHAFLRGTPAKAKK